MKRILVLDTGKEWGGGTNSLIELLKRIDRTRFEMTACFYNDYPKGGHSSLSREFSALGIPLLLLPPQRQPWWAKLGKELARGLLVWHPAWRKAAVFAIEQRWRIRPRAAQLAALMRRGGQQLLYVNNQPSSNLEAYLAAEQLGVPLVQHCRIEAKLNADEVATVNRVARAVICVSHGVAESLARQGVVPERLHVVCNAIDGKQPLPVPQRLDGVPADAVVVGTVGSLIKRKAVNHLLRAVAALGDAQVHALIVGEGPEGPALRALAAQLGLAGRVHFAGFQQGPLPWVAAMDIFCLVSASEGLPRVILEAMLLGKPVIATDITGSRELVRHGETGFLVPFGDDSALQKALLRLVADETLRAAMGQRGREIVLAEYSIERYIQGVEQILGDIGNDAREEMAT